MEHIRYLPEQWITEMRTKLKFEFTKALTIHVVSASGHLHLSCATVAGDVVCAFELDTDASVGTLEHEIKNFANEVIIDESQRHLQIRSVTAFSEDGKVSKRCSFLKDSCRLTIRVVCKEIITNGDVNKALRREELRKLSEDDVMVPIFNSEIPRGLTARNKALAMVLARERFEAENVVSGLMYPKTTAADYLDRLEETGVWCFVGRASLKPFGLPALPSFLIAVILLWSPSPPPLAAPVILMPPPLSPPE